MPDRPTSRFATFRDAFISGALLLAPLVVTLWAFSRIINLVGGTFRPYFFFYLPGSLRDRPSLEVVWDILATLIVIVLVTLLGYVSRDMFGRFFVRVAERFFLSIPGVGAVYTTVKQIVDTFGTQNRHMFNKVVLVEFPRKGAWTLAFLTSKAQGEPQIRTGRETWTVYRADHAQPDERLHPHAPARGDRRTRYDRGRRHEDDHLRRRRRPPLGPAAHSGLRQVNELLATEGFVLLRRPSAADGWQTFTLFSRRARPAARAPAPAEKAVDDASSSSTCSTRPRCPSRQRTRAAPGSFARPA